MPILWTLLRLWKAHIGLFNTSSYLGYSLWTSHHLYRLNVPTTSFSPCPAGFSCGAFKKSYNELQECPSKPHISSSKRIWLQAVYLPVHDVPIASQSGPANPTCFLSCRYNLFCTAPKPDSAVRVIIADSLLECNGCESRFFKKTTLNLMKLQVLLSSIRKENSQICSL